MSNSSLVDITAEIVAAYVSNNPVQSEQLADLIQTIHETVSSIFSNASVSFPAGQGVASINPSETVFDDYIICLEDGRQFKSLKRHLWSHYQITPEQYRAKWNLPADYPMVAPNYAKHRSHIAKNVGLGHTPRGKAKSKERMAG